MTCFLWVYRRVSKSRERSSFGSEMGFKASIDTVSWGLKNGFKVSRDSFLGSKEWFQSLGKEVSLLVKGGFKVFVNMVSLGLKNGF